MKKVHGEIIDKEFIRKRIAKSHGMGFPEPPKWVQFCKQLLEEGYVLKLHEAYETMSKYITVYGAGDTKYKIRFSNHKPIKGLELAGSCDFFVGITHTGARTTQEALEAVRAFFNAL